MKSTVKYFKGSFWFSLVMSLLGFVYVYSQTYSIPASMSALAIIMILGALEVSLSFDNAIVNAKVLSDMDEKWRKRFITWGVPTAVFGMRIFFPILIVSIFGDISMYDALKLGFENPSKYAEIMHESHLQIAAFGGAFLMLVSLSFFFDHEKEIHWIKIVEKYLSKIGSLKAAEVVTVILALIYVTTLLDKSSQVSFLISGLMGIVIHEIVKSFGELMESEEATLDAAKAGLMSFIYLEVLDASFSADGVLGALVITNDIVIIAIGLGIGAMFVRSLTLMLVDKGTIGEYKFLEHGAFYSIFALSVIMFMSIFHEIPELVTGSISVSLILAGFISSIISKK